MQQLHLGLAAGAGVCILAVCNHRVAPGVVFLNQLFAGGAGVPVLISIIAFVIAIAVVVDNDVFTFVAADMANGDVIAANCIVLIGTSVVAVLASPNVSVFAVADADGVVVEIFNRSLVATFDAVGGSIAGGVMLVDHLFAALFTNIAAAFFAEGNVLEPVVVNVLNIALVVAEEAMVGIIAEGIMGHSFCCAAV